MTCSRSISLYGLSDVILTFQNGTDNYFARQQVFERLADLTLPVGRDARRSRRCPRPRASSTATCCRAPTARRWSSRPSRTGSSSRSTARCRASPTTPASAAARCSTRCCSIRPRSPRVGLSVPQVESALGANNGNAGGGFYSQGGQFYYVRGLGRLEHARGHRQRRARRAQRHAGAGEGRRPRRRSASRRASGEFGYEDQDDAVEGVILHAHRREDPGRAASASRPRPRELNERDPAQGREGPSLLRPQRPDQPHHARSWRETCCAAWCSWSWC